MKLYMHQKQKGNELLQKRFIFFASQGSDSSTSETEKTKSRLPEFHQKMVDRFKPGIQKHVKKDLITDEDYRHEISPVLMDSAKMTEDRYQHFMIALSEGKLRDPMRFWKAINGSKNSKERQRAEEILEDLKKPEVKEYSKAKEAKYIAELNEIAAEEITDETRDQAREVSKTTEKDDTHRLSKKTRKSVDRMLPGKQIYLPENPPKELMEAMHKVDKKIKTIMKRVIYLHDYADKLIEDGQKNHARDPLMQIKKLELRLKKLYEQVDKPEWKDYLSRVSKQKKAIDRLSKRLGIDFLDTEKIIIWMIDENVDNMRRGIGATGLQVDSAGLAKKLEGEIKITEIFFNDSEDPAEAGEARIKYINEDGTEEEASFVDFQKFLEPLEAYAVEEKADDRKALRKLLKARLGYDIEPGDTFTQVYIVENDENGEPESVSEQFQIEDLFQNENGEWIIKLDKPVMTNTRNKFHAQPAVFYFDRLQQKFNVNQFVTFVKRNDVTASSKLIDNTSRKELLQRGQKEYRLSIEEQTKGMDPEVQEIHKFLSGHPEHNLSDEQQKHAAALLEPEGETKVIDPKKGEEESTIFRLNNGQKVRGRVRRNEDNTIDWEMDSEDEEGNSVLYSAASGLLGKRKHDPRFTPDQDKKGKNHFPEEPDQEKSIARDPNNKTWKFRDIPQDLNAEVANQGQYQDATNDQIAELRKQAPTQTGETTQPDTETPPPSGGAPEASDLDQRIILPYDQMAKREIGSPKHTGYLRSVWLHTRFLSFGDLWEMGKVIYEFAKRKWERDQKERFADVGKHLPWMKPEMERINQQAEQEQVDQYKAGLENEGTMTVQEKLRSTNDRDELKACFIVLSAKGELRWDDVEMWTQLNRWGDSSKVSLIPIPGNGDPHTIVDNEGNTGLHYAQAVVDDIWGEGTYDEWFRQNKSNFNSNVQGFFEKGKELEAITEGIDKELQKLLLMHKQGQYVNPHLYESLIHYAIDNGKSNMYAKVYYLVQGVTATNPNGRTILSFDRIAHLNGTLLAKFPIFDYFTAPVDRKGAPEGKESNKFTMEDYRSWAEYFNSHDPNGECKPNEAVNQFLWNYVIPHKSTQWRISKALRDPQLDHEDMPYFMPSADVQSVNDLTKPTAGSRRFFSNEAYANAFPGYSQYIKSLGEKCHQQGGKPDPTKVDYLLGSIASYVRYESILMERYEPKNNAFRLPKTMLERPAIMSQGVPLNAVIGDLNGVIKNAIDYYAQYDSRLAGASDEIYNSGINKFSSDAEIKRNMEVHEVFTEHFGDIVKKVDGGKELFRMINSANLTGLPYQSDREKAIIKARIAKQTGQALDDSGGGE
ncbi:hypothetical protein ACFL21_03745 [Patescibacteria group bacterium]